MQFSRLLALAISGCCLALAPSLHAQAPAWTPDKQFSTDETVTTRDGRTMSGKFYFDNDKIRSEMNMGGMNVTSIVRPDLKKLYSLMPTQKMAVEMPLIDDKGKQIPTLTAGADTKFDFAGPAVVDGVACSKYKMTVTSSNKVFYWWVNAATNTPVRFQAEDGSVTLAFSNYKAGPQDASLFEVPSGYKTMQMPAGMGMPGGGAPPSAPAGQ